MGTYLWHHHHCSYFFHHFVIIWRNTIQICCHLDFQIRNGYELFKNVFRKYISDCILSDFIIIDINLVGSKMKIGGTNGSKPPIRMTFVLLLFEWFGSCDYYFLPMDIHSSSSDCCLLSSFFCLLLYFSYLTLLQRKRSYFHSQNNVSNFTLSKRSNDNIVFFSKIS